MNDLRMSRYERMVLTFSVVLMVVVSLTALIVLYFSLNSKDAIISTVDEFYTILLPFVFVFLILLFFGFIGFLLVTARVFFFRGLGGNKKDVLEVTPEDITQMNETERDFLLQELKEKKERIEYLIRLAEEKYHTRKLDSESFREIVRDNQVKIMEIEAKMNEINQKLKELN